MPHKQPPIEHRFSATNPPPPRPRTPRGPYLTPLLKRFLNKKIKYEDPETQKMIEGKVKDAVIWRLLLNACQGENEAIKEILNRIDGKNIETLIDLSTHSHFVKVYLPEQKEEQSYCKADRNFMETA